MFSVYTLLRLLRKYWKRIRNTFYETNKQTNKQYEWFARNRFYLKESPVVSTSCAPNAIEHRLGVLHSRKTNLWSCKSTNRGFLKAIFNFEFPSVAILKCDAFGLQCQAHSCLIQYKITREGLALQPKHLTFQDGDAGKFKIEKSPSENLDLWTYKTKDSFLCYATHLIYVQRAF